MVKKICHQILKQYLDIKDEKRNMTIRFVCSVFLNIACPLSSSFDHRIVSPYI